MPSAHDFLVALALVLGVAAVTTVVFHKLKQPVVLGYLVAGLLVGPHFAAFPLTANTELIQALSELGVILLMFALGLEFRLGAIARVGASSVRSSTAPRSNAKRPSARTSTARWLSASGGASAQARWE